MQRGRKYKEKVSGSHSYLMMERGTGKKEKESKKVAALLA